MSKSKRRKERRAGNQRAAPEPVAETPADAESAPASTPAETRPTEPAAGADSAAADDGLPAGPLRRWGWDLLAATVLVLLAFGVRSLYASVTEPHLSVQADAYKYYLMSYYLHRFGVASIEPPKKDESPPTTRTDLRAGYPLWLAHFWQRPNPEKPKVEFNLDKVLLWQRILGSLTVLCAFILGRLALPRGYAVAGAAVTALNPHLIALEGFALTETLCTFLLALGAATAGLAWRTRSPWLAPLLALAAGMVLQSSAYVRAIAMVIALCLSPLLLLPAPAESRPLWQRLINAVAVIAGALIVVASYKAFETRAVHLETADGTVAPEAKYVAIRSPAFYLNRSLRPPDFYVKGGSFINQYYPNKDYRLPTELTFAQAPMAYLRWNLGGKLMLMWHWDNCYFEDVYTYAMKRKGFEENIVLKVIHRVMRFLHWPMYLLALVAPLLFLLQLWRRCWRADYHALWVAGVGLYYVIGVLTVVAWQPRYSVPARPVAGVLVGAALWVLLQLWRDWRRGLRLLPRRAAAKSGRKR